MRTLYKHFMLRIKYSKLNAFSRGIYKLKNSHCMIWEKFDFLNQYKDRLNDIDSKLYKKLNENDKSMFILWVFKHWCFLHNRLDRGGGITFPKEYDWILFKNNALFFEVEKLCNKRKSLNEPLRLVVNDKEILYIHPHCGLNVDSRTMSESFFNVCLIVHTFFLQEYYLDGFNPKNGETIIDCGGAVGDTALFFNAYYPDSDIHIFELNDMEYNMLKNNIAINNKQDRLFAYKMGVGSKSQTMYFNGSDFHSTKTQNSTAVDFISIDSFVEKNNIKNIGLIKMDIEGGEQEALKGAIKTIIKFKPKLMIPIYHLESDIFEIPNFLHSLGLKMEFRVKWTDMRFGYYDFILLVRFL